MGGPPSSPARPRSRSRSRIRVSPRLRSPSPPRATAGPRVVWRGDGDVARSVPRRRADAGHRSLGDQGARRALPGADGDRRPSGRRGRGRARRAGQGAPSSAARATTAATAWWPRAPCERLGFEVDALLLAPGRPALRGRSREPRALRGRAPRRRAASSPPRSRVRVWSSTRSSAPASPAPPATRPAPRSTRSTRRRAGGGDGHRLRCERLDRRGRGQGRRTPTHRDLSRAQARPLGRPGQGPHRASCGWRRSASQMERPSRRPPG